MAAGDANMAYKKEVAATKEVKPANTEMATFALGLILGAGCPVRASRWCDSNPSGICRRN